MTDESIVGRIRSVAEAFTGQGLARLTLKDSQFELELRRSAPYPAPNAAPPPVETAPVASVTEPATPGKKPDIIASDLVGVVRFARPQVAEGGQLEEDRELAYVEALGIRNPVRSRGAGTIKAVFVSDGQPVEYGQPLFAIER